MRLIDADALVKLFGYAEADTLDERMMNLAVRRIIKEQPTISQWIPVSERLPNDDEMSKCLYVNKYGDFIIDAYISKVGGTYECENEYTILCDVVAWMPLPEPYKESDNE